MKLYVLKKQVLIPMKKNKSSFEISIPSKSSEYIFAALTGEEVSIDDEIIYLSADSLKDLRSRWNLSLIHI